MGRAYLHGPLSRLTGGTLCVRILVWAHSNWCRFAGTWTSYIEVDSTAPGTGGPTNRPRH